MASSLSRSDIAVETVPPSLSCLTEKLGLFAADPCFRDGWRHVGERWGAGAEARLWRLTSVLFKPEAVVARSIERGLAFLREAGFRPVALMPLQLNRALVEELARYQINIATPERVEVVHLLTGSGPSLYLVLADERQPSAVPATVRLVELKGNVDPSRREPGSLRSALGSSSRLVNHIHTPDEPADLVRELGVLFSSDERAALLEHATADRDRSREVTAHAQRLYERHSPHDLDFDRCLERIRAAAHRRSAAPDAIRELQELCGALQSRRDGDSSQLFRLAERLGVEVAHWDRIVVAAELVQSDVPGETPTLPTVGRELWEQLAGGGPSGGCEGAPVLGVEQVDVARVDP